MLTRLHVAAALAAVSLLACGGDGPSAAPRGTPTPSPTLPSVPSYDPATVQVTHGGFSTLYYKTPKKGHLRVEVESRRTPSGVVTVVRYVRQVNCSLEAIAPGQASAGCDVAWEVEHEVSEAAFTYDATLDAATLTHSVRGKKVRVTWAGYGEPRRQVNENGNLMTELREARGSVTWGSDRYTDPDDTKTPSRLFRRITPLAERPS